MNDLASRGYLIFPPEPSLVIWARAARRHAATAGRDATGWRCGGTWWPGIDALPNDPDGAVDGAGLHGAAIYAADWGGPWHRAQLSICRPGYPRRGDDESAAQHRFRLRRAAAHLDGLLPVGPARRRKVRELHAFVLGIGLSGASEGAAPLVVWEGSHAVLGPALSACLRASAAPTDTDLTDIYQKTRRAVFETCAARAIPLAPGAAVLLHRHLLHGIAPWTAPAGAPRATAYFRPLLSRTRDWLWPGPA